jgi:putative component of membrane protein insertase Oxa1/YidC/SpoIIIJ protein YidD
MKYLILYIIKLYWLIKPKNSKPKCIFKKSCSHYIYVKTEKHGLTEGIKAFVFRFKNCRNGFEIFNNPITGEVQMILPTQIIVKKNEISERLIK